MVQWRRLSARQPLGDRSPPCTRKPSTHQCSSTFGFLMPKQPRADQDVGVISLVFYGVGSIGVGYLMFQSGYLPRLVGILLAIGGAGFVIRTFAVVLVPAAPTSILKLPMILVSPLRRSGCWPRALT